MFDFARNDGAIANKINEILSFGDYDSNDSLDWRKKEPKSMK